MYIPVWAIVVIVVAAWYVTSQLQSKLRVEIAGLRKELAELRKEVDELRDSFEDHGDATKDVQSEIDAIRSDIAALGSREEVVAKRFLVVDSNGKPRGFFGMEGGASPSLLFMEEDGIIPTYLRHSPEGWAVLRLGNRGGEEVMATVDTRVDSRTDVGKGPFAFVSVTDRDGFNTTIGRVHEIEKVDAASWNRLAAAALVMTKDREVIWCAP
jgi:hypothetical protein